MVCHAVGFGLFGRLCENFTFLPLIGCAVLASTLNFLGLSLAISQMGWVELVQWFPVSLLLQPHNGDAILHDTLALVNPVWGGHFPGHFR